MGNMFDMIKQAASLKKNLKNIQSELARKTFEHQSRDGLVKVKSRGDMTVAEITIDPSLLTADRKAKLESMLVSCANGSLDMAKKAAGKELSGLAGGLSLPGLV